MPGNRRWQGHIDWAQLLMINAGQRMTLHGWLASQTFKKHQPPSVQIRLDRRRFPTQLLRRTVRRRSHDFLGHRQRLVVRLTLIRYQRSNTKIEHLGVNLQAGAGHHNIVWLEIAVHHPTSVRTGQSIQYLSHHLARFECRQWAAAHQKRL